MLDPSVIFWQSILDQTTSDWGTILVDVLSVPSVRDGCVFAEAHMFRKRTTRALQKPSLAYTSVTHLKSCHLQMQEIWHGRRPCQYRSHFGSIFRLMPVTGRLARD